MGARSINVSTAVHDYARIWRKLTPAERDRRITIALDRLANGETLKQVAATWQTTAATLCRALIAHAPQEWRRALAARALVRYEQAINWHAKDPSNPMARARVWATRWHLEYALQKLAKTDVEVRGQEIIGTCPECSERRVFARMGQSARCFECGWEGDAKRYLLDPLQVDPA